jgi:hypothetical protein
LQELQRRARTRYVSSYDLALAFAAVGEREQAFRSLEQAYNERQSGLRLLKVDDRLESLRSDPRYTDLLRRLGLLTATSTGARMRRAARRRSHALSAADRLVLRARGTGRLRRRPGERRRAVTLPCHNRRAHKEENRRPRSC